MTNKITVLLLLLLLLTASGSESISELDDQHRIKIFGDMNPTQVMKSFGLPFHPLQKGPNGFPLWHFRPSVDGKERLMIGNLNLVDRKLRINNRPVWSIKLKFYLDLENVSGGWKCYSSIYHLTVDKHEVCPLNICNPAFPCPHKK